MTFTTMLDDALTAGRINRSDRDLLIAAWDRALEPTMDDRRMRWHYDRKKIEASKRKAIVFILAGMHPRRVAQRVQLSGKSVYNIANQLVAEGRIPEYRQVRREISRDQMADIDCRRAEGEAWLTIAESYGYSRQGLNKAIARRRKIDWTI